MLQNLFTWIDKRFNHPLVPLFFFLGFVFLIVGLTTGYKGVGAANQTMRYMSIAVGSICLVISVILYYKAPKKLSIASKQPAEKHEMYSKGTILNIPISLAVELGKSFSARKDDMSITQKGLLDFIEIETKKRENIPQEDFDENFPSHVFWRLEVLIWMGFIEKEYSNRKRYGKPLFHYRLSPEYKRELGR